MRSKGSGVDSPANGVLGVPQATHDITQEEEGNLMANEKNKLVKVEKNEDEEKIISEMEQEKDKSSEKDDQTFGLRDLSKDDLLKLLGLMEGELQAREDVIRLLRSERGQPEALESRYGSTGPSKALQALQRDSLLLPHHKTQDHVFRRPLAELQRLQDKHRDAYRRMLEQLLHAEKCQRRTLNDLDTEKRKHVDYMNKSDDFTNLLEQERERLKKLLEQEKAYQVRKENEHTKRLEKVRGELVKLKSFALMLVDERQLHLEQIDQQNQKIQEFLQRIQDNEEKLKKADDQAEEDKQKINKLELELDLKVTKFTHEQEEMTAKLASQETQNCQLHQKVAELSQKIEELEESNGTLQKSAHELLDLKEKVNTGEYGKANLLAELEDLHKKILEMEGKDDEITKTETECIELRKKLQDEEIKSKELKIEVEKLQKRMAELEKLEQAFGEGRTECAQLQANLEKEKSQTKELSDELVTVKIRMKELESSELRSEKAEQSLRDDLMKLKSVTVILVNERKTLAERMMSEENKREELKKLLKSEQGKVMEVTERLIEESRKLLKLKSEMENQITALTKEKDELRFKFSNEEEKNKDLSSKVCWMKQRIHEFEEVGKDSKGKLMLKELGRLSGCGKDENKVKELTSEIERLKNRLRQLEVIEGDLAKTEDEYDMLEKKFRTEQDKANILSQQVEEMMSQIVYNKAIERQEAALHQHCRIEEAKTRDLQADVLALKEKIHELMNKEDQLSQLQVDYSLLQQRFIEEEDRRKSISHEVLSLTKELEATKRYSRALRPSNNGRRMMDVPLTSTGVQTDIVANETAEDDTPAVFIKKSVQEENHIMNNLRQKSLKKPTAMCVHQSSTTSEHTLKKSWIPWMRRKESHSQISSEKTVQIIREHSELTTSQRPGQSLPIHQQSQNQNHFQVAPGDQSTKAEDLISGAAIAPPNGLQKPRITIIPSPATVSPRYRNSESGVLERTKSPVTGSTIPRTKNTENIHFVDRPTSPASIASFSTSSMSDMSSSPEPQEMITGRAVFKVTPEKRMVPPPIKKSNLNANIFTTEDAKIHIHLGSQFKKPFENNSSKLTVRPVTAATDSKESPTGTVLRSPRKITSSKVTSSISITQVTTAPARPTLSVQPIPDGQPPRSGLTRIPMPRTMKSGKAMLGALGINNGMKMETRTETQSMRVEMKKTTVSTTSFQSGGKG